MSRPIEDPNSDLGGAIVTGARWTGASQVAVQLVRLASVAVLARLLSPEHFGLMAMALVVTNFLEIFKDLGTSAALIQRRQLSRSLPDTLFVVNLGVGLLLSAAVYAAAPLVARVYDDPDVVPVLRVMCLAILISSTAVVHQALLRRSMRFARLGLVQMSNALMTALSSILLAAFGLGVWALAWGLVLGTTGGAMVAWVAARWTPHLRFRMADLREVLSFSLNLSGERLATFALFSLDKVFIGRFLGASILGLYSVAQRILIQPVNTATRALHDVLFAGLSRLQDDADALADAYVRTTAGVAMIIFPVVGGLGAVADPAVPLVLGGEWAPAAPIVAILAPGVAVKALISTTGKVYMVRARTDLMLRWSIFSGSVTAAAWYAGLPWGLEGVAAGFTLAVLALAYPAFAIPLRLISLPVRRLARALAPITAASLAMVLTALAVLEFGSRMGASDGLRLSVAIMAGTVTYGGTCWWLRLPSIDDLARLIGHDLPKRSVRRPSKRAIS